MAKQTMLTNLFLVVLVSKEWFLTLGADKVFHVPLFAKCGNDTLLDRTATSTADGNAHLIVTSQAIQLVLDFAST